MFTAVEMVRTWFYLCTEHACLWPSVWWWTHCGCVQADLCVWKCILVWLAAQTILQVLCQYWLWPSHLKPCFGFRVNILRTARICLVVSSLIPSDNATNWIPQCCLIFVICFSCNSLSSRCHKTSLYVCVTAYMYVCCVTAYIGLVFFAVSLVAKILCVFVHDNVPGGFINIWLSSYHHSNSMAQFFSTYCLWSTIIKD